MKPRTCACGADLEYEGKQTWRCYNVQCQVYEVGPPSHVSEKLADDDELGLARRVVDQIADAHRDVVIRGRGVVRVDSETVSAVYPDVTTQPDDADHTDP